MTITGNARTFGTARNVPRGCSTLSAAISVLGGRPNPVISPPSGRYPHTLIMAVVHCRARHTCRLRRYGAAKRVGAAIARVVVVLCSTHAAPGNAAQDPCATIRQLCENAGFVQGAAQSGNGLQRDCIQPILQGATQSSGASRPLPVVDPQLVSACRAAKPNLGQSNATPKAPPPGPASSNLPGGSASRTLTYVPGSTHKINQLVGEVDKQTHQPTLSLTESRYHLQGTDLGYLFEHLGKIYFLFGDTVGARNAALDSVATVDAGPEAMGPERGVRLDFLTQSPGLYLTVQPPGITWELSRYRRRQPTMGAARTRGNTDHHERHAGRRVGKLVPGTCTMADDLR
jgi:hypothetical protein